MSLESRIWQNELMVLEARYKRNAEIEAAGHESREINLRYVVCQAKFRKDKELCVIVLTKQLQFERTLDETQSTRPHPISSQSPESDTASATAGTAAPGAVQASSPEGSASPIVGPSDTTGGVAAEQAGNIYEEDAGLEVGALSLSRQASRASAGAEITTAEGEAGPVAEVQSSSSDEESYNGIVEDFVDHFKDYDADTFNNLIGTDDDKDLKKEYHEAAAAASAKGGKDWPKLKRIWKVVESIKVEGVVYAVGEFAVPILEWWDPALSHLNFTH